MTTLLVCGQGRCGSGLMMQMLTQGGIDAGSHPECKWPGFEDPRATRDPGGEWMAEYGGKALKVLTPDDYPPGTGKFASIWLDRDCREQAKSWIKIQRKRFGTSGDVPTIARKLKRDRKRHLVALRAVCPSIFYLRFESLLKEPDVWCERLAEFLSEHGFTVDTQPMIDAVIPRRPQCAIGIMEETLAKIGPPGVFQPLNQEPVTLDGFDVEHL